MGQNSVFSRLESLMNTAYYLSNDFSVGNNLLQNTVSPHTNPTVSRITDGLVYSFEDASKSINLGTSLTCYF